VGFLEDLSGKKRGKIEKDKREKRKIESKKNVKNREKKSGKIKRKREEKNETKRDKSISKRGRGAEAKTKKTGKKRKTKQIKHNHYTIDATTFFSTAI